VEEVVGLVMGLVVALVAALENYKIQLQIQVD
jgi:hypothetical protein